MEDHFSWSGNISHTAQAKVKKELESYIRNGMGHCPCGPLNINIKADKNGIYFAAQISCGCGASNDFGDIEGTIPIV